MGKWTCKCRRWERLKRGVRNAERGIRSLDFCRPSFRLGDRIMQLTNEEVRRYSRHLILPEVGMAGQKKICSASVLCIGAGGLGSPIAMYLAAAGIGKVGIVDFDSVDFSNLQRQIIHTTDDVGRPKTTSAKETINAINPNVE